LLRLGTRHVGTLDGVVNPKRDHAYLVFNDAKNVHHFGLHFARVDENMVNELILNSKRTSV
jgi:hypothetical protein